MALRHEIPTALRQTAETIGTARGRLVQLHRTFERSLIPMVLVDNDRRHVDVNAAARLVFRMSLRELRELRIDDLTAERDLPAMREAWDELFERGTLSDRHLVTFQDGSRLGVFYAAIANVVPGQHLIVFVPADWPGDELDGLQPAVQADSRTPLSTRQLEVLRLVAIGASASQIADELSISAATVRTHVKNILDRLGAKNRAHAVALAIGEGMLSAHDEKLALSGRGQ